MAKNSIKSQAREYYKKHLTVTLKEFTDMFADVLPSTINKYLIEFRKLFGVKATDVSDQISVSKLEKELSLQLERNPTSAVIKSCIDFLRLKAVTDDTTEEIDMEKFFKLGKAL